MDFGIFIAIALFMAVTGIPTVRRIVSDRRAIFDRTLTPRDRVAVDQAAFYLLLPVSVALHELGHATMVWLFGGEVTGFGYFVFAGYVSYQGNFTDAQGIFVAFAGPAVSVALGVVAVALVLLKRPPMRAAYNELLVQFAILTGANALIFYPALDLLGGVSGGDFRQMYDGGVPALSAVIAVLHLGMLVLGWYLLRGEWAVAKLGALTELPPHVRRGVFGGFRARNDVSPPATTQPIGPAEAALRNALQRVASGWDVPVRGTMMRSARGPALLAAWRRSDGDRAVAAVHEPSGAVAVQIATDGLDRTPFGFSAQVQRRWAELPSEDELVLAIRLAMEAADARPASTRGRAGASTGSG